MNGCWFKDSSMGGSAFVSLSDYLLMLIIIIDRFTVKWISDKKHLVKNSILEKLLLINNKYKYWLYSAISNYSKLEFAYL